MPVQNQQQQSTTVKSSTVSSFMCCTTDRAQKTISYKESQSKFLWLDPTRWVERKPRKTEVCQQNCLGNSTFVTTKPVKCLQSWRCLLSLLHDAYKVYIIQGWDSPSLSIILIGTFLMKYSAQAESCDKTTRGISAHTINLAYLLYFELQLVTLIINVLHIYEFPTLLWSNSY